MQIPQVRKPLRRLHNREMNIQIPITLLRLSNHAHQLFDRSINLRILLPVQKIASAFQPLRDIRVPEEMVWDRPHVRLVGVRFMPFELECIIATCLF